MGVSVERELGITPVITPMPTPLNKMTAIDAITTIGLVLL
jgi:hypothetical protein